VAVTVTSQILASDREFYGSANLTVFLKFTQIVLCCYGNENVLITSNNEINYKTANVIDKTVTILSRVV